MMELLVRTRLILGVLAVLGVAMLAIPARAQQGQLIDPDASAVSQQMLLKESPRIQGHTVLLDQKAAVLEQPAGRTWRYFHEVLLRWIGAIAILGTIAALGLPMPSSGGCGSRPGAPAPAFSASTRSSGSSIG